MIRMFESTGHALYLLSIQRTVQGYKEMIIHFV